MTVSAARNAPHAKPLSRLARLAAAALLIPLGARAGRKTGTYHEIELGL